MNNQKLVDSLKNIIFQFGAAVLSNESTFTSLLADYVPELTLERKLIKEAISVNALKDITDANFSTDEEKNNALLRAQQKLINLCGINDNLAADILNCFSEALGWNVSLPLSITQQELETEKEKLKSEQPHDVAINNNIENFFTRAYLFLEERNWELATQYFNRILDNDPKCPKAYLGLFMAENGIRSEDDFGLTPMELDLDKNASLMHAISFASPQEKTDILQKVEKARKAYDSKYGILAELREKWKSAKKLLFVGDHNIVIVRLDGTMECFGEYDYDTYGINNIVTAVENSGYIAYVTGLGEAAGVYKSRSYFDGRKQCYQRGEISSFGWLNIKKLDCGYSCTIGLKKDGTLVATGENRAHQCDVYNWDNVVDVACGSSHTVGLKKDGTLVSCGAQDYFWGTFDKTDNDKGQCNLSDLSDIVSVACGNYHTVALKKDGTVVARGLNADGQCNTEAWTDVVEVSCGNRTTFGLRKDGTVLSCGSNDCGQCETGFWRDIVAVEAANYFTIGVRSDGTIVSAGFSEARNQLGNPRLFNSINTIEQEKENIIKNNVILAPLEASVILRKQKGKCPYCGGLFQGHIKKICSNCGRKKDY